MLANEKAPSFSDEELATVYRESARAARGLAHHLVKFERNPDPMREREAPNPAHGIRIRVLRPVANARVAVGQDVKDHNSAVRDLRKR